MEVGEWGQDEQQGRRPHTSRLQDEINIKFSIIRRSPVYSPVAFYVIHPRGRAKNKTMRVIFHLFIHKWPDIFEGNLRTSRIAVEMRQKKKIRVKFHTTRALPIRSCCQKSKSATRATAYCHSTQGATKGFRTGQLGNVKPPIKTSMRVTKIIILNIHSLTILFFNGARNGTFCEWINFSWSFPHI